MAKIKADTEALRTEAKNMKECVQSLVGIISCMKNTMSAFDEKWQGDDRLHYDKRWEEAIGAGSAFEQLIAAIDEFADGLLAAAGIYADVQIDAVHRARVLRR